MFDFVRNRRMFYLLSAVFLILLGMGMPTQAGSTLASASLAARS